MHRFGDIRLQKCCDLENWVRCPSRSLEMLPCDRLTSYWRSIVTVALSRFWDIQCWKMSWPWNWGHRSLRVKSGTIR